MPETRIVCPICGQSDLVDKVSAIYMEGLGAARLPGSNRPSKTPPGRLTHVSADQVYSLSKQLAPPSTGRDRTIRPLHPDLAFIGLTIILPVFLTGIWNSQHSIFFPILGILAVIYFLYFLARKRLISRFDKEKAARLAEQERIRKGIQRWMELYYCSRDEGFFRPRDITLTPVDQLYQYLLEQ